MGRLIWETGYFAVLMAPSAALTIIGFLISMENKILSIPFFILAVILFYLYPYTLVIM